MAEFREIMEKGNRMCSSIEKCSECPICRMLYTSCIFNSDKEPFLSDDYSYSDFEREITAWNEAHPPKKEITWKELIKRYISEPESNAFMMEQPVPDEVWKALLGFGKDVIE